MRLDRKHADAIYLSMIRDKNVNWCNALGRTKTRMQNNGKRSCKKTFTTSVTGFLPAQLSTNVWNVVCSAWSLGTCTPLSRLTGQVCCTTLSHPAAERQNPADNTPSSRCYHFTNQNFN